MAVHCHSGLAMQPTFLLKPAYTHVLKLAPHGLLELIYNILLACGMGSMFLLMDNQDAGSRVALGRRENNKA